MKPSNKIRVAVLFGGRSAEHEVSLQSAANVIQYLDPNQFEVIPIGIDKQGNWLMNEHVFEKSLEHASVPKSHDDSHTWFTAEWVGKAVTQQEATSMTRMENGARHFDVVFPAVHGALCEDGTLQGLLELAGIPYVGCGVLASAMGMDKDISKRLAMHANILVPSYLVIKKERFLQLPDQCVNDIEQQLTYPVFVKPANTGSSIGITKVKTKDQLKSAIDNAFQFDTKILVEKALDIIELEIAALESLKPNEDPIVSVVGEVKPRHEFYTYEAKYVDEQGAELIIPADIPNEIAESARRIAQQLFKILECEGMSRVDLFLEKGTNKIYFNEINTIPGFTQISMYPKLMSASGMAYAELLTHLIKLAIKRHQNRSELIRNYTGDRIVEPNRTA
ncbi:MAG: D-alanine--D-alanine ligase A [Gammaproteobacteria bacterium RIFCSPHIGHO2_12_FULL_42_10]|nr:MAG: D-alanine--D-alanine ligase A [Gammaproteobacteria bacterium RIFCSPHIGHO2_12_FULL_42_10]